MKKAKHIHWVASLALLSILVGLAGVLAYQSVIQKNVQRADIPEISDSSAVVDFESCASTEGAVILESYPRQCRFGNESYAEDISDDIVQTSTFISGQEGFSAELPQDWGEIIKPLDSDSLYIMGVEQPNGPLFINEQESFGTDAPSVFSVAIHDNFAEPMGNAGPYTLVNGKENPIDGTRYVQVYEEDEPETDGIGYRRLAGDRNYTYVFDLGDGRSLRVFYSVYQDDPKNMINTVEAVVDSIKILE